MEEITITKFDETSLLVEEPIISRNVITINHLLQQKSDYIIARDNAIAEIAKIDAILEKWQELWVVVKNDLGINID